MIDYCLHYFKHGNYHEITERCLLTGINLAKRWNYCKPELCTHFISKEEFEKRERLENE